MQCFRHVRGCPLRLINISEAGGVRITILEWSSCFRKSVGRFSDGCAHLARLVTRIALTIRFTTFRIVSAGGPLARLPLWEVLRTRMEQGSRSGIYVVRDLRNAE